MITVQDKAQLSRLLQRERLIFSKLNQYFTQVNDPDMENLLFRASQVCQAHSNILKGMLDATMLTDIKTY